MKRLLCLIACFVLLFCCASCNEGSDEVTQAGNNVLRICNWEDYISENEDTGLTLYEEFEEWYEAENGVDITIEYSTFGTPEILYNNLKINPGSYDLVCPSDYMIQKMQNEGMLETFDDIPTNIPNYYNYASGYMLDLFEQNGWTDYSIPYMWGTMGFIYNPEFVTDEEASTWACAINEKFKNKTTIKDSVRDTYFLGVALTKIDELREKNEAFTQKEITFTEYSTYLATVFNDTSANTIAAVEDVLIKAKENAFSLEVDSGKDDMVTGKVWLNFAWSGDAVYAMDEAEPVTLNYAVPKEGSNIWFDGWVMPKGANKELCYAFLNYISAPEKACENMDYIGYTSSIAGQEVFDRLVDMFGCDPEDEGAVAVDLSYYFDNLDEGNEAIVYVNERNRQFDAQYPSEEITSRCAIMQYFDDNENDAVNSMWNRVKADDAVQNIIIICSVIGAILLFYVILKIQQHGINYRRTPRGYKRVE